MKETVKGVALATVKGVVGAVPVVGSLFSEYIGLATEAIASKRQNEWQSMIEENSPIWIAKYLKLQVTVSFIPAFKLLL